jgi:chromosomal replication initiator protein
MRHAASVLEPSVDVIIEAVATAFAVTPRVIRSSRRNSSAVMARHCAMWLSRQMTTHSYPAIARAMGNLDHTTVIHGVRRIGQRIDADASFAELVVGLMTTIEASVMADLTRVSP